MFILCGAPAEKHMCHFCSQRDCEQLLGDRSQVTVTFQGSKRTKLPLSYFKSDFVFVWKFMPRLNLLTHMNTDMFLLRKQKERKLRERNWEKVAEEAKEQRDQLPVSQALRVAVLLLRDLGQHCPWGCVCSSRCFSHFRCREFQWVSAPGNQQTLVRTDGKCKKDHYNDGNKMLIMLHTAMILF